MNEEVSIGIKQEEIPEDISFPDIKTEPVEVSYVCVCLLLDTFYQCSEMSVVFVMPIFLASWYSYMVERKTYTFLLVGKNPYSQDISFRKHPWEYEFFYQTNLISYALDFFNLPPTWLERWQSIIPFIKGYL